MAKQFDVVVIGAGPGGYIAAIRAAQLGMSVACVDSWSTKDGKPAPGGTCTNIGCIPSKALLQSSEHYEEAKSTFAAHGIEVKGVKLDIDTFLERKDTVVEQNNQGLLYLFRKNKVNYFHGKAAFKAKVDNGWAIDVTGADNESLVAKHVIVATGSSPRALPGVEFDEEVILSNDGALSLPKVPKKLGVIGAGVIGLELGSVWRRLGSKVTILEGLPDFLSAVERDVAKEAHKLFTKQGLEIHLGAKVESVEKTKSGVNVKYTDKEGKEQRLKVDN